MAQVTYQVTPSRPPNLGAHTSLLGPAITSPSPIPLEGRFTLVWKPSQRRLRADCAARDIIAYPSHSPDAHPTRQRAADLHRAHPNRPRHFRPRRTPRKRASLALIFPSPTLFRPQTSFAASLRRRFSARTTFCEKWPPIRHRKPHTAHSASRSVQYFFFFPGKFIFGQNSPVAKSGQSFQLLNMPFRKSRLWQILGQQ